MSLPRVKRMGVLFDEYTPAVEAQMCRDVILMQQVARHRKISDLIIICDDSRPDRMLSALGVSREPFHNNCQDWVSYRTQAEWPQEPDNARVLIQRDLYVPVADSNMQVLKDGTNNGYYLPPQGRLSPDTLSLLRPAPNGYIPVDPALVMIWT